MCTLIKPVPSYQRTFIIQCCREACVLDDRSSLSADASPSSLPSYFTPSVAAAPALYEVGRGEQSSGSDLADLQPHLVFMRCTNLVLGFVRLCVSCGQLHKGVLDRVANWMFASIPYKEYLRRATGGDGEVRFCCDILLYFLLSCPDLAG